MKRLIALLCIFCLLAAGCAGKSRQALGADLERVPITGKLLDADFEQGQAAFSLALFQQAAKESEGENLLISPLSVLPALAMTANGAEGQTREEMLQVLGGYSMENLNGYLYKYLHGFGDEVKLANSIWLRDAEALTVHEDFLQTNVDCYDASIFKAPFDETTLKEINSWVEEHTDGMIGEIIDEIRATTMLYLINALAFEAEWQTPYTKSDIRTNNFYARDGSVQDAEMMYSNEHYYIEDEKGTGFVKDYAGGDYRFAVLLPNEGIDVYEYAAGLTAEGLRHTLGSIQSVSVEAAMPKFSYEYEILLNGALAGMGMPTAFSVSEADFSAMAEYEYGDLYISEVRHKTFIAVDERGTKAGAVTSVAVDEAFSSAGKKVRLDRPFVYMIIDEQHNLPLFMGILASVN